MFAFTEMDGYNMTEDDTKPTYMFPNDDPLYESANTSILRGTPQIMDRQAPEVQMTLDHTTLDGDQVWSFTAYDPDQALGIVDPADGDRMLWQELYEKLGKFEADPTDWSKGYILGTTSDGMKQYTYALYPLLSDVSLRTYAAAGISMPGRRAHV